jgi:hypothetical protein
MYTGFRDSTDGPTNARSGAQYQFRHLQCDFDIKFCILSSFNPLIDHTFLIFSLFSVLPSLYLSRTVLSNPGVLLASASAPRAPVVIPPALQQLIDRGVCTFAATGEQFAPQPYANRSIFMFSRLRLFCYFSSMF